jgi:phosphoserine phosphatase
MPDVVLIRPGCTDFDEQHRIQGTLDLPMNARGQEQVQDLIEQLRPSALETLYATSGEPSRSTAAAIGASLGIPVKELDGLHNLDQGLWQGLLLEDVRRKYPKVFKQLQESPETICPPQGETVPEAVERVRKALKKPLKKKKQIGIVAPEPLATLIASVLRGGKLDGPVPICGCNSDSRIERIATDGEPEPEPAAAPVNGQNGHAPHANGVNGNGQNGSTPQVVAASVGELEYSRGGDGL